MPFYRMPFGFVHMKGTKLPAPCRAKVWIDGKEQLCAAMSGFLCDWPDGGGRTCDAPLCEAHAYQVGTNRHYCPAHQANEPQRPLFNFPTHYESTHGH
jgi:hypothetical protein